MVLRIGAALAASSFETVVYSPRPKKERERKKSRNHTAATGQAGHSVAISFKPGFLSPPLPDHLPSEGKVRFSSPMPYWLLFYVDRVTIATHDAVSIQLFSSANRSSYSTV